MAWRYLPFQHYNPYYKTGLNQALIESVEEGKAKPTIFLSGWKPGCVNLGRSQKFEEEVNIENFKQSDYLLVRRQGGGGATLLTENGEITWGIVAPKKQYPDDINKIYQKVCGKIAQNLKDIGIKASHEPINDIVTQKGKLSGSTIKQKENTLYIGGTMLYQVDAEEMFRILSPSKEKLKDKQIKDFKDRVTSINKETNLTFEETVQALKNNLLKDKKYEEGKLTTYEHQKAEKYAEKYKKTTWLHPK